MHVVVVEVEVVVVVVVDWGGRRGDCQGGGEEHAGEDTCMHAA